MSSDLIAAAVTAWGNDNTSAFVSLHTGPPGPDGSDNLAAETGRAQVAVGVDGARIRIDSRANWPHVRAAHGSWSTITHLSVWSLPAGGAFWFAIPIQPLRVPHMAELDIPPGATVDLAPLVPAP